MFLRDKLSKNAAAGMLDNPGEQENRPKPQETC